MAEWRKRLAVESSSNDIFRTTTSDQSGLASHPPWPALPQPEAATNTWTGNGDGINWSNAPNWSDGIVPLPCQDVVVPAGTVKVLAGFNAVGKTLEMVLGAVLTMEPTGTMEVQN